MDLTHINKEGNAKMVDVSEKEVTIRIAKATSTVKMPKKPVKVQVS